MTQWSYAKKTGVGVTTGMRFNNFVVGPSNSSAFSAARSVAADLGSRDNPLVLCGQPGTGKTHLLNAVGAEVLDATPEAQVRYVSAGSFSRELAEAAEQGTVAAYLDSLAAHDLLLVDDIHLDEPAMRQRIAGSTRGSLERLTALSDTLAKLGGAR